jgi:hypothetical protein
MRTCCCRSSTESKYGTYIGFNLRDVPKNTDISGHHLLPRLGSPVEKAAEGEQLMKWCVPSLEGKRAVIFEEKSLTASGC